MPRVTKTGSCALGTCLLLWLLCVDYAQGGDFSGLVLLQNSYFFSVGKGVVGGGGQISYTAASQYCEDHGGVLPAIYNTFARSQMSNECLRQAGSTPCILYTGGDGDTTVTAAQCDNEPATDDPSTSVCSYRYRFGFFDKYTYQGEPGTAFWRTYYAGGADRELNGYTTAWTSSKRGGNSLPYGRKKVAAFVISGMAVDVCDVNDVPFTDDLVKGKDYITVCEIQTVLFQFRTTAALKQPNVRQTWIDPTWTQSHWYVIFLVLAIVILLVIIAIIIYCACTAREKPAELPIHCLVVHEHSGNLYCKQSTKQVRDASFGDSAGGSRLRQGFGFNPLAAAPQQQADPDDAVQNMPTVYNRGGDVLIYSQGNSVASDDSDVSSKVQGTTASRRAPSASSKRSAKRRNTSRTASQAFSDVELPQGQEIKEDNTDLEL